MMMQILLLAMANMIRRIENMRKNDILNVLNQALDSARELEKRCRGEESRCVCKDMKTMRLYINTWITSRIEHAIWDLER